MKHHPAFWLPTFVFVAAAQAQGTAPAATAAAAEPTSPVMTLWKLIESGGWAMIPLGFLSVLTLMFVLYFLFTLRRGAVVTAKFMNTADALLKKRDYVGLLAISNRHSEVVARVVQRTLDFLTKNPTAAPETVREIAQSEGSSQAAALQTRITYLADIGMLSPMVGLLGTVFGIIRAFGTLASSDTSAASRPILLAGGVSEALVATATGLIVGIVSFGCYALFRNRVQGLISDLEVAAAHLVAVLGLSQAKQRAAQPKGFEVEDDWAP